MLLKVRHLSQSRTAQFAVVGLVSCLLSAASAHAAPPELFCTINSDGQGLACQYKDRRDSSKTFTDEDIGAFIEKATTGAYITVKSKRGFERTYEVDPSASDFKHLENSRKSETASELARQKLDIFSELEKKAIQISDGLDTVFIQSDLLKYDPAVAYDKCRQDMGSSATNSAYEQNMEVLKSENKALSVFLTSLIKAFKDPSSCMADFKLNVAADGSVDLSQLQGLAQAFKNRCKRKS